MNNMHTAKKQDGYVAKERSRIANHKAALGLRYVAESLRGKIVKSSWLEQTLEDGSVFKLNTRIRVGETPSGKEFVKTDRTLIIAKIGSDLAKEISEAKSNLMHTSIGVVCCTCLTSDHVLKDKDGRGFTCTRCNSWIANA